MIVILMQYCPTKSHTHSFNLSLFLIGCTLEICNRKRSCLVFVFPYIILKMCFFSHLAMMRFSLTTVYPPALVTVRWTKSATSVVSSHDSTCLTQVNDSGKTVLVIFQ